MAKRLAWLLNFDAEMEMADPVGYRPSTRMLAHCDRLEQALLPSMRQCLGSEPVLIPRAGAHRRGSDLTGYRALAWSPTPSALEWMRGKGIEPVAYPDFEALCRVNHRAFLAEFQASLDKDRDCLPGEVFVTELQALEEHLAAFDPGRTWLLKRPFGFAGRDRKQVTGSVLEAGDRTWAELSMRAYGKGLQVEPMVDVQAEFGLHAWLEPGGDVLMGELQRQIVDARGAYVEARSCAEERSCDWIGVEMEAALRGLSQAAADAGYFGPLGLDSYLWKDMQGALRLRVASDLNARFSMAWFQGMEKPLRAAQPWG